jgi:folate-dependent phosphoribosylglycinamide formyltransferase PurN
VAQGAIQRGELSARIQFVFSNREPGEAEGSDRFFQQVHDYGIPLVTLSSQRFRRERGGGPFSRHRLEFDREVMKRLEGYKPDLCVMAGYMLIVDAEMCQRYTMLNLHPALPGGLVGTWQEVIWKVIQEKAQEAGA